MWRRIADFQQSPRTLPNVHNNYGVRIFCPLPPHRNVKWRVEIMFKNSRCRISIAFPPTLPRLWFVICRGIPHFVGRSVSKNYFAQFSPQEHHMCAVCFIFYSEWCICTKVNTILLAAPRRGSMRMQSTCWIVVEWVRRTGPRNIFMRRRWGDMYT